MCLYIHVRARLQYVLSPFHEAAALSGGGVEDIAKESKNSHLFRYRGTQVGAIIPRA